MYNSRMKLFFILLIQIFNIVCGANVCQIRQTPEGAHSLILKTHLSWSNFDVDSEGKDKYV